MVKNFLKEKNIYFQFEKSYKNLVKEVYIYNLRNNRKSTYLYEELKNEKFKILGIESIPSFLKYILKIQKEKKFFWKNSLFFKKLKWKKSFKEKCIEKITTIVFYLLNIHLIYMINWIKI